MKNLRQGGMFFLMIIMVVIYFFFIFLTEEYGNIIYTSLALIFSIIYSKKKFKEDKISHIVVVFLFISNMSLLSVYTYLEAYSSPLGPYYDDSLYYYNSINLSKFILTYVPPTFFEFILAGFHLVNRFFTGVNCSFVNLLPFNWGLGTIVVFYVKYLSSLLFKEHKASLFIVIVTLLFNFSFLDTAIHLYRDILLLFLVLLFIDKLINKKSIISLLLIVFCVFWIRGANAILLLFLLVVYKCIVSYKYPIKRVIFFTVVAGVLSVLMINFLPSSLLRGGGVKGTATLVQTLDERFDAQVGNNFLAKNEYSKNTLYPIFFAFSPYFIAVNDGFHVRHAFEEDLYGFPIGTYDNSFVDNFQFFLHVISISFSLFLVFSFFKEWRLFRGDKKMVSLVFFYIVAIYLIGIVSLQPRHRLVYLLLIPIFSQSSIYYLRKRRGYNPFSVILVLFFILLLFNIFLFM